MKSIDIINMCIKMVIINVSLYLVYIKIINYKENDWMKNLIILFSSIMFSIVYVIATKYINPMFTMIGIYVIYTIYATELKILLRQKFNYSLILTNISFIITYFIYLISVYISGMVLLTVFTRINYNSTISLVIIFFFMCFIYYVLSRTRRLKDGINFLKNIDNAEKISKISNLAFLISIIVLGLPHNSENNFLNYMFTWIAVLGFSSTVYWIRSQITKFYKNNMKDRTIEVQKLEIDEKQKIIEEIKEENLKLADVVHRYNNRLSAVENALEEAINKNTNTEFSNELSVILEETKEISKNFAKESEVVKNKLPKTNIPGIDNMFKYMQKEALENSISFNLKINDSIYDLIDNVIQKDKFETMLGDHLRDAIIAINYSKSTYRSILVTLGLVENCYELSIYDTGIEFEIDTLLKLGKERITTHKSSGGSGIGFMTTFETLSNTKASLRIEEYDSEKSTYTKSVNFRFDGKNEYRIYSYRAEKIKKQNIDKKIIIKEI